MAIDVGGKRTGIAVTDPLQIIATGLVTIEAHTLVDFIKNYIRTEQVDRFIVGWPTNWDDSPTHGTPNAAKAIQLLQKNFPTINPSHSRPLDLQWGCHYFLWAVPGSLIHFDLFLSTVVVSNCN